MSIKDDPPHYIYLSPLKIARVYGYAGDA